MGDTFTSGGVTINAETVNIDGNMVGRDNTALAQAVPLQPQPVEPTPVFRLLVIVSRPLDVNELPAIADQWRLVQGLQTVNAPVAVKVLRPPTLDGLRTELLAGYDVIHFDGHGDYGHICPRCSRYVSFDEDEPLTHCPKCDTSLEDAQSIGLLFFEKEDGTFEALPAPDFARLITAVPDQPTKLVALSACRSAMGDDHSLAQTLAYGGGVPSVLGMKEVVTVEATLKFFQPFYAALGAGATIEEAKQIGCDALKRVQNPRTDTPIDELPSLIGPGVDKVLCPKGSPKGRVQIEPDRLVGVPDAANFYGLYIEDDPPRGRKGLLAQLARAMLNGQRLIALVGTGGIGKTWLASVGARRLAWRFPGGVFWRSAADIADFRLDHLLDAFAPIFGQQFYQLPTPAKRDLALQYLRDLRTNALIVVDNAETIKDEGVWKFLTELPDPSAAIITTREAPEYGYAVIDVSGMDREESVNLFIMEGDRVKNAAQWLRSEDDLKRVIEVCALLDGHPLAILIAAALLRGMNLTSALAQMKSNPARGEISKRFDFSYNPLPDSQKDLLHRLAAFASHIQSWFIDNLCTNTHFCGDHPLPSWQSDLIELVRKSFVEYLGFEGKDEEGNDVTIDRYRLHPVMRDYAVHKAGAETMRQHNFNAARLLVAFAQQFSDNFDVLENELPNLLGAMDWADEERQDARGKTKEAARLATQMMWATQVFLNTRGYWSELTHRLERAIAATNQAGDAHGEGAFANMRAMTLASQGSLVEAKSQYEKALALARQHGFKQGESATLHELGRLAQDTGDLAEARRLYEQSQQINRELGDKQGIAQALHELGRLAQNTGDLAEARRLYEQSLQIKRELSDKQGIATTLHQLGRLAQGAGDLAEARHLYEQSLQIARELGDKRGIASSLHQLARLAQDTGDLAEARRLYEQSQQINRELDDKRGIAQSLHQLGVLAQDTGDLVEARRLYEQSLQTLRALGDKQGIASSLHQLGRLAEKEGHLAEALQLFEESFKVLNDLQSPNAKVAERSIARVREQVEKQSNG